MRLLRHRLSINDLLGVLQSNLADELQTVPGWGYSVQYEDLMKKQSALLVRSPDPKEHIDEYNCQSDWSILTLPRAKG